MRRWYTHRPPGLRAPDFEYPPYFVYVRPHVAALLALLAPHYDFAVWSSASRDYVDAVAAHLFGGEFQPKFVWAVERCVQRPDARTNSYVYVKDLRKVRGQGYAVEQITMLDDSRDKLARQPRNVVLAHPYLGEEDDDHLVAIGRDLIERARVRSSGTPSR